MEPAPVLIVPLQIHVRRRGQVRPVFQNGGMTDPRIEPDVEDVRLLPEMFMSAGGANRTREHQVFRLLFEPDIGAMIPDQGDHTIQKFFRQEFLIALFAVKNRQGYAPQALAGNTPVGPAFDHPENPVMTPGGNPLHLVNRLQGFLPEIVFLHGDEPLFRGTENDGLLAPPAVGIGMLEIDAPQESAPFSQFVVDGVVGVKDELAGEKFHVFRKFTVRINGGIIVETVLHTDLVVFLAMARRDVDTTRPGIESHEGGKDDDTFPIHQGMAAALSFHNRSGKLIEDFIGFMAVIKGIQTVIEQFLGHNEDFATDLDGHINEFLMKGNGQIRRNRPGGGRPNDEMNLLAGQFRTQGADIGHHGKLHINGRRVMFRVLHFRFRQGGFTGGAPVNGLFPLVDAAAQIELAEFLDRRRLVIVRHGEVRIFPVSEHTQALELLPLQVHELPCVDPAGLAFFHL